ncbi:MAG: pyridoxal phosphate-dependent aminotransferase [Armatimonadetes bacterium]|nr:pyridoxal phosphate-dependent aminotransferase [Armatimonadota bacterium]
MRLAQRMSRLGTENAFTVLAQVQRLAAAGHDIINLGIGDPDFDTPTYIKEAACHSLAEGRTHYSPSQGIPPLRAAIAAELTRTRGVPFSADEIVVTPGAKPILFYVLLALAEEGDEVLYPNPGFPIYESCIEFVGARAVPIPLLEERDFQLDIKALQRAVGPRTRVLILNSPNNPTGGVLSRGDLEVVAGLAQRYDAWVMADEIYSRFLFEGRFESIAALPGMKERTIIVDGFSKTYAMTGWRMGYGVMPAALAQKITQLIINSVSCTATFIQDAGITALQGPQDESDRMIAEFRARRDLVVAGLNTIPGIHCRTPGGAFYAFPNVTEACRRLRLPNAEAFQDRAMRDAGVAVLARSNFGRRNEGETEEYVRLSFAASREHLQEGLRRLRGFVERGAE